MKRLFMLLCLPIFARAQSDTIKTAAQFFTSKYDSTPIYYEVYGTGKPVLLVHGFMNSSANWKKTMLFSGLLSNGYQVILLDQRGNGKSGKPHTAEGYANDAEAKDIMQLVSLLHLPSYDVVGYSRGAIITARLLVLDKRIHKAVIGGMGEHFTNPEWPRRIQFYHALIADTVEALHSMVENVHKNGLDRLALAYQQKEQPSVSNKELSAITIPVKVICGDKDSANGSGAALTKLIPGATFTEVPGEHNTAWGTKAFADAVLVFLKK